MIRSAFQPPLHCVLNRPIKRSSFCKSSWENVLDSYSFLFEIFVLLLFFPVRERIR